MPLEVTEKRQLVTGTGRVIEVPAAQSPRSSIEGLTTPRPGVESSEALDHAARPYDPKLSGHATLTGTYDEHMRTRLREEIPEVHEVPPLAFEDEEGGVPHGHPKNVAA